MIRVVQITARGVLPEDELARRLEQLETAAPDVRREIALQLREPGLEPGTLLALARRLRARTAAVGARLFVNDRLDVARLVGADGVHLGRHSVSVSDARKASPGLLVSRSAHTPDEASEAFAQGADVVLLSPVFASPGKGRPLGLAALAVEVPPGRSLLALGGVEASSVEACLAAGATGVASLRADLVSAWVARAVGR